METEPIVSEIEEIEKHGKVAGYLMIAWILFLAGMILFLTGCKASYKGGRIVNGTDAFVGLNVPMSDGVVQFEMLNYVSGFRFTFAENAAVTCTYSETNKTSFCGIWDNEYQKHFTAKLEPVEVDAGQSAAIGTGAETNETAAAVLVAVAATNVVTAAEDPEHTNGVPVAVGSDVAAAAEE